MTNTSTPPSKQDVYDSLSELKKGRSRGRAYVAIKGILYRYGNGAKHINELDPKYYATVIAAVTIPTAQFAEDQVKHIPLKAPTAADIYGTTTDVQPEPTQSLGRAPNRARHIPLDAAASSRIRTPMVADLQARLAARAGKPRSKPNYIVNTGNPAHFGDEDAPRQYPNDGRRVS